MSEKGGKGAVPVPSKTSLKSSSKTSGKEDGSTKSKKARKKVQFSSEPSFSPSSTGKAGSPFSKGAADTPFSKGAADSPFTKANSGKGGKGGKGDKTGKASKSKEPQPVELKVEQELPKHAKCLMDCEAREILQGIQDRMVILSEDPSIKIPVSFDRGLQYAKTRPQYTDQESVKRVLGELKKLGATEGEICVISSVCPESVDEAFALVPSLKAKKSKLMEPLKGVLSELATLKVST